MKDVAPTIADWLKQGRQVALSTVIKTWGSSPRKVGANMAVDAEGNIVGSVSGGCVEGAVVELSQSVLADGPSQKVHFGVSDETAWGVGLACGGEIDVFVESLDPGHFSFVEQAIEAELPVATLTITEGPEPWLGRKLTVRGNQGEEVLADWEDDCIPDRALEIAKDAIRTSRSGSHMLVAEEGTEPELEVFVEVVPPPPSLIMVGGVHISVALAEFAKVLGYRTVVVDPRRAFGTPERFPEVDQLITSWPEEAFEGLALNTGTAIAVLTHDPKIDDPALMIALPSPAFYVGVLGSRRTHEKRLARLREAGLEEDLLDRLHAPIGLDIGAKSPEEIALSVLAEIIKVRRTGV
ncbi:MAG: XdhC family protein [Anaerolineales bacterium]